MKNVLYYAVHTLVYVNFYVIWLHLVTGTDENLAQWNNLLKKVFSYWFNKRHAVQNCLNSIFPQKIWFLSKNYLWNLIDFVCQKLLCNNTDPLKILINDVLFVLAWLVCLRDWRTSICLSGWRAILCDVGGGDGVLAWMVWVWGTYVAITSQPLRF